MSKSNQLDLTEGPILSKLLQFSIPLILSSLLQLLFNAADVVVVGRFAGNNSLAAVGSTGSLINLLVNLAKKAAEVLGDRFDIEIVEGVNGIKYWHSYKRPSKSKTLNGYVNSILGWHYSLPIVY